MKVDHLRTLLLKVIRLALFDHACLQGKDNEHSFAIYGHEIVALHGLTSVLDRANLLFTHEGEPWVSEPVSRALGITYRAASRRSGIDETKEQVEAMRRFRRRVQARVPSIDESKGEIVERLQQWLGLINIVAEYQLRMLQSQQ